MLCPLVPPESGRKQIGIWSCWERSGTTERTALADGGRCSWGLSEWRGSAERLRVRKLCVFWWVSNETLLTRLHTSPTETGDNGRR